nr:epidermal growth factor receptor substrate 15-like 1 [Ipomoea batatas]
MAAPNMDQFEAYFRRADLDQDGRISGAEAVSFFQGANLPKQVLAQIWMYADQSQTGFLSRQDFYNALKLVTVAQSKRELTPDIVKAALFGPASAKIPAPQINLAAIPGPQPNNMSNSPVPSVGAGVPSAGPSSGTRGHQVFQPQQSQLARPPRPPAPSTTFQSHPAVSGPGVPVGSTMTSSNSPISPDMNGGRTSGSQPGVTPQLSYRGISPKSHDGFGLVASGSTPPQSKPQDAALPGHHPPAKDSKTHQATGNGFSSNSLFGDVFSATSIQPNQASKPPKSSASSVSISSSPNPVSSGSQQKVKSNSIDSLQNMHSKQPAGYQYQQTPSSVKQYQHVPLQTSNAIPGGAGNTASSQSHLPWPRMTQADVQKYSKVFVAVDTDRDGKITGEQARNLFLSWKLPREILRQVWDLSDQDNDSMLSLREFCISLYLMERYREGRPPPPVLPTSIMLDEAMAASGQPTAVHSGAAWRHTPGIPQPQGTKGTHQAAPGSFGKPPRPVPISQPDEARQPTQQKPKPKVPMLEKHLVEQLSSEEQDSLNSKFQEATEAEKKVAELEKEIMDAKEKIQFFHAKMQELILYKSRCDNRLNEITERTSADKKEVELFAKKYEEKYKQTGDVASKLTIQEATFRDIQEKKMELYQAIVKMDQDGNADSTKDRANHIQKDLEELIKSLNERCKTYGLHAKPTSLLELPFGWQPGIQEGAADWDGDWDKFEDEGFTSLKELTLDVQNVIAPSKTKSSLIREKVSSGDARETGKSRLDADVGAENLSSPVKSTVVDEVTSVHSDDQRARSPPESPSKSNAFDSPSKELREFQPRKEFNFDGSPHAMQGDHGGAESVFSSDKGFDESGWGTFDTNYDSDAAWDFNRVASKNADNETQKENPLFGFDDWGLAPIKTGSKYAVDTVPKLGPSFDSVPSTPSYNTGAPPAGDVLPKQSLFFDSVPSTPSYNAPTQAGDKFSKQMPFFDSVPSTPSYNAGFTQAGDTFSKQSSFFDSVPSTPNYNAGFTQAGDTFSKQGSFFDSVPSTPSYNTGFSYTENAFSKQSPFFDSVPSTPAYSSNLHADDMFQRKSSFADSVPSTPMYGSTNSPRRFSEGPEEFSRDFSRFDSFSSHDGSNLFALDASFSRFDSMRSTKDSEFDHGLFPPHDSLARFDSFRSTADSEYTFGNPPPRDSFARFDSFRSTKDSEYGHGFASFDDADPFGSSGPFKTSFESETPRRDSSGPFKTSFESETPRRDSDSWKAF